MFEKLLSSQISETEFIVNLSGTVLTGLNLTFKSSGFNWLKKIKAENIRTREPTERRIKSFASDFLDQVSEPI